MNKVSNDCQIYQFIFPKPKTFREVLFAPRTVVRTDGTMAERMQRWLIDHGDFYSRVGKSIKPYVTDSRHPKPSFVIEKIEGIYQSLDKYFLVESFVGHSFYIMMTSIMLRPIELFAQSARNPLNFSMCSPEIQRVVNFLIIPVVIGFSLSLGYVWHDLAFFGLSHIVLEKVLSYTWSNYFKQINTLSSTKDFIFKDFVYKNMQAALVRMMPTLFAIILWGWSRLPFNEANPAYMTVCQDRPHFFSIPHFARDASGPSINLDLWLEPILLSLGRMIFDLVYILILKTISKDTDLRDPMGWMFSMFRKQESTSMSDDVEGQGGDGRRINKKTGLAGLKRKVEVGVQETVVDDSFSSGLSESISNYNYTEKNEEKVHNKEKIKTRGIGYVEPKSKSIKEENSKAKELQTEINIEVGGCIRTFQRIEDSTFNKETWGVIVADSVEKSKLKRYETGLSNGCLGGTIKQLKGHGGHCYEIGANMAARLLGKRYDDSVYQSLQSFMRLEEALQVSQELERQGISDDVSLIVFSAEAPNHDSIHAIAAKL